MWDPWSTPGQWKHFVRNKRMTQGPCTKSGAEKVANASLIQICIKALCCAGRANVTWLLGSTVRIPALDMVCATSIWCVLMLISHSSVLKGWEQFKRKRKVRNAVDPECKWLKLWHRFDTQESSFLCSWTRFHELILWTTTTNNYRCYVPCNHVCMLLMIKAWSCFLLSNFWVPKVDSWGLWYT